jgi:hypothetical protein
MQPTAPARGKKIMALIINQVKFVQITYNSKSYYMERIYYDAIAGRLKRAGQTVNNTRVYQYAIELMHFCEITQDCARYLLHPAWISYHYYDPSEAEIQKARDELHILRGENL